MNDTRENSNRVNPFYEELERLIKLLIDHQNIQAETGDPWFDIHWVAKRTGWSASELNRFVEFLYHNQYIQVRMSNDSTPFFVKSIILLPAGAEWYHDEIRKKAMNDKTDIEHDITTVDPRKVFVV